MAVGGGGGIFVTSGTVQPVRNGDDLVGDPHIGAIDAADFPPGSARVAAHDGDLGALVDLGNQRIAGPWSLTHVGIGGLDLHLNGW